MRSPILATALFLLSLSASATTSYTHPGKNQPFKSPPDVNLEYAVKASYKSVPITGTSKITWLDDESNQTYTINTIVTAPLLELTTHSAGSIAALGLTPQIYEEKLSIVLAKKPTSKTVFDRNTQTISFYKSDKDAPLKTAQLKNGDQDRTSVIWQLVGMVSAAPEKFTVGSTWTFAVAGASDKGDWTFTVQPTPEPSEILGQKGVKTLHLARTSGSGPRLSIWLAQSFNWYPVHINFVDDDITIDQTITSIDK